jgi:hypothetical protein
MLDEQVTGPDLAFGRRSRGFGRGGGRCGGGQKFHAGQGRDLIVRQAFRLVPDGSLGIGIVWGPV